MLRVWDAKTCDCLASFRPPAALAGAERAVLSVHANPQNVDHILVCTRSNTAFMMTLQGQVSIPAQRNSEGRFWFPQSFVGHCGCPNTPPHSRSLCAQPCSSPLWQQLGAPQGTMESSDLGE